MTDCFGYVTTDYAAITDLQERDMQTLSIEALCAEWLIEDLFEEAE